MADCCEPGCTREVLCPVHQALADLRDRIAARYDDIKGQPGHERNPEYWDGVLDGLDVAEQIVEKEAR